MYSRDHLLRLALAYCRYTGIALSTLGSRIVGNDKLFVGLAAGGDCRMSAGERASEYFISSWPIDLAWPDDVPLSPRRPRLRPRKDLSSAPRGAAPIP